MENARRTLTDIDGNRARELVVRICEVLTLVGGRKFGAEMTRFIDDDGYVCYEGHIVDHGKFVEDCDGNICLSENGTDEIGMVFFGGFYLEKDHSNAEELAWISLLEDCVGMCCDEDIRKIHNLSRSLQGICGPYIDLNVSSVKELEHWLDHGNT